MILPKTRLNQGGRSVIQRHAHHDKTKLCLSFCSLCLTLFVLYFIFVIFFIFWWFNFSTQFLHILFMHFLTSYMVLFVTFSQGLNSWNTQLWYESLLGYGNHIIPQPILVNPYTASKRGGHYVDHRPVF
jgi:hypothetical protein